MKGKSRVYPFYFMHTPYRLLLSRLYSTGDFHECVMTRGEFVTAVTPAGDDGETVGVYAFVCCAAQREGATATDRVVWITRAFGDLFISECYKWLVGVFDRRLPGVLEAAAGHDHDDDDEEEEEDEEEGGGAAAAQ